MPIKSPKQAGTRQVQTWGSAVPTTGKGLKKADHLVDRVGESTYSKIDPLLAPLGFVLWLVLDKCWVN